MKNHPGLVLAALMACHMPGVRMREVRTNGAFVGKGRYRAMGENDWRAKAKRVEKRRRLRKENKNP